MAHHLEKLKQEIFSLSNEKDDWDKACEEWWLIYVSKSESRKCICGHNITMEFWIENEQNDNKAYVGSECIRHFTGNKQMVNDAESAKKNLERKLAGKSEIGKCSVCNRSTSMWRERTSEFIHKTCYRQRSIKEERKAKDAEWLDNKPYLEKYLPIIRERLDEMEEKDKSFAERFSHSLSQQLEQGMSNNQKKVIEKWIKKYNWN
jgi:hypothetical protein